jgi:two-component system sensor histidine kinase DesK
LIYWPTLFIEPAMRHSSALVWTGTVVVSLVFLVSYFRAYWLDDRGMLRIVAMQVLLGLALAPINGGAWVLFVYAAAFVGQTENTARAVRLIGVITGMGVVAAMLSHTPLYYVATALVITPLIGAINLHYSQLGRANANLHRARGDIEHLATVAERERIARDMHDVLGHTLSMIVLKAELASKLAERDPARAIAEIREVEQVARQALHEVRATIGGYRATLGEEAGRARALLDAAGIACEIDVPHVQLDRNREEVLALALREAVTNVVRHSGARRVAIRVSERGEDWQLEVVDDGRGGECVEGSGLRGMRARVEAVGGTLFRTRDNGTRLTVRL